VVAVLLLAAALRLARPGEVPPGFQFDEAHNAIDAARVLSGRLRLFFPDNGGREPLVTYLHAAAMAVLGRDLAVPALRLVSAGVGILSVAALYGFASRFLLARRPALFAAGFLAASYWHLHFSRYGLRAILAPLWTLAALWCWWLAVGPLPDARGLSDTPARRGVRLLPAAACGAFLAVAVYSHPSGRLLPLILLLHTAFRLLTARRAAAPAVAALFAAGVTAAIAFAPLGWYFWRHPGQFTAHPSDVSLSAVAAAQHGGSLLRALADNLRLVAGMPFLSGDPSTLHNLPHLPAFDPLSALLAVLGAGVVVGWLASRRPSLVDRGLFLAAWFAVGLLPTLLSDRAPNYSRAMVALPPLVLLPGLGLAWALGPARRRRPALPSAAAALVLCAAAAWTAYHHFAAFPRLPAVFYSYDMEKVEAHRALVRLAADAEVLLHPLWAGHATVAFLDHEGALRPFDGRDSLLLAPDGRAALVAFPAREGERQGWVQDARSLYGHAAATVIVTDSRGAALLRALRVPATAAGDMRPPRDAPLEPRAFDLVAFGGAVRLVGHTLGEARPGEPLSVVLVWEALDPPPTDLTVFVHVVGPTGQPWGQDDREPAHASYRTSGWRAGDILIDRYRPVLHPDASGEIEVLVGWYDRVSGSRLVTEDGRDAYRLGPLPVRAAAEAP